MKHESRKTFLIAAAFACVIGFSGAACLVTGFSLASVDLAAVLLVCAGYSAGAAWCFSRKKGILLLTGIWLAAAWYLLLADRLFPELESFLFQVTSHYDSAYRWGAIRWSDTDITLVSPAVGVYLLAWIAITAAAWTLTHRKPAIWAVSCGILPLIICLVVTNTVPASWCLFLLLGSMALLMITNTVRRRSAAEGNRLTALLLIPTLLATSLLFWAVPRDGYTIGGNDLQQAILNWVQNLPFVQSVGDGSLHLGVGTNRGDHVDLSEIGPNIQGKRVVMEVTSTAGGLLYLRGQSFDTYTGKAWEVTKVSTGKDAGWAEKGAFIAGSVEIFTQARYEKLYLPYYPGGIPNSTNFVDGSVENQTWTRTYLVTVMEPQSYSGAPYTVDEQYLYLPETTKALAQKHLTAMGLSAHNLTGSRVAEQIRAYVQSAASYDLNTQKMPGNETDFAMWFLDGSDTGYCVHFATAAAVLLRSAGIPARYVTGYIVNLRENEKTTVTADKAHAWVEYLDAQKGWTILEATPAGGIPDEQLPTVSTEPSQTTEPTRGEDPDPTRPSVDHTEPSLDMTLPSGDRPDDTPQKTTDLGWLWETLKWLGIAIGIVALVGGQYALRLRLRKKKMRTGPSNRRALAQWREVLRYTKLLKKKPPEELIFLAEKAKFSQHSLAVSERRVFDEYLDICKAELAAKPLIQRFLFRIIWAVE